MHPARNKRPAGAQRADQLQKAVRCCQTALRPTPFADHFHVRFHCLQRYSLSLQASSADGDAMRMPAHNRCARAQDHYRRRIAAPAVWGEHAADVLQEPQGLMLLQSRIDIQAGL